MGHPSAVATSALNETFAIDAARGIVVKWDSGRRFERVIGGYDAGAGTLAEPVGLALGDAGLLYVADRGRKEVLVYDRFGTYARAIGNGMLDSLRTVTISGGKLWVLMDDRLLIFNLEGLLLRTYALSTRQPVIDVAVEGDTVYLLTRKHLYRTVL